MYTKDESTCRSRLKSQPPFISFLRCVFCLPFPLCKVRTTKWSWNMKWNGQWAKWVMRWLLIFWLAKAFGQQKCLIFLNYSSQHPNNKKLTLHKAYAFLYHSHLIISWYYHVWCFNHKTNERQQATQQYKYVLRLYLWFVLLPFKAVKWIVNVQK